MRFIRSKTFRAKLLVVDVMFLEMHNESAVASPGSSSKKMVLTTKLPSTGRVARIGRSDKESTSIGNALY
jgi:hypothetical protein